MFARMWYEKLSNPRGTSFLSEDGAWSREKTRGKERETEGERERDRKRERWTGKQTET